MKILHKNICNKYRSSYEKFHYPDGDDNWIYKRRGENIEIYYYNKRINNKILKILLSYKSTDDNYSKRYIIKRENLYIRFEACCYNSYFLHNISQKYKNKLTDGNFPAYVNISDDGSILSIAYHTNGKMHNTEKPAYINYSKNIRKYFINGEEMSKVEWFIEKAKANV